MKKVLGALVVAGSLAGATSGAIAMNSEVNQLTGALYTALATRGLPTENLHKLSMAEILQIEQILSNGDSGGEMRNAVGSIIRKAAE